MKRAWAIMASLVLGVSASHATLITYDFDSNLSDSTSGSDLTAGSISFTHGSNSNASTERNAERGQYSGDTTGDAVYFISARSSDNKGFADANLNPGTASYLSFDLTPNAGQRLNFSSATLDLDATLYTDDVNTFNMSYKVFYDIGSGWVAADALKTISLTTSTFAVNDMYEAGTTTSITPGWRLSANVDSLEAGLMFELSSIGELGIDQSINFAIALSGDRDNSTSYGSSLDNIVLGGVNDAIPEPSTLALLASGFICLMTRRKFTA